MTALVTQPEAHLLTLARAAVGAVSPSEVMRLLVTSVSPPPKLGPTARRVLSDTLSRGAVLALVRGGGWKQEHGRRLWERHDAPKLEFTPNLIRLFQWVLRTPLTELDVAPLVLHAPLTPAEELVATLLFERVKGTSCEHTLARQQAFRTSPLAVLMHASDIARASLVKTDAPLEVIPPIRVADHAPLIEGLRDLLARSWLDAERQKHDVERPDVMVRIGRTQEAVLAALVKSAGAVRYRGLFSFLIDAGVTWLAQPHTAEEYVGGLNPDAPLRERGEARRQAGSFLRALGQLRVWDQDHRSIRFIDDDYDTAQYLVRSWERFGDRGFREAERLLAELDALPV